MQPKLIYVIGPLTSHGDLAENLRRTAQLFAILMANGFAPFGPHLAAACPGAVKGIPGGVAGAASCALVKLADAVALLEGWDESAGASAEWAAWCAHNHDDATPYSVPVLVPPGDDEDAFNILHFTRSPPSFAEWTTAELDNNLRRSGIAP